MPTRRPTTSVLLITGAAVLVVSILVGQKLGDRVLLQTERRAPVLGAQITAVPVPQESDPGPLRNWRRDQVISVATDPGFPDPRVTRPPTPTPAPAPKPTDTPRPAATATAAPEYTSPPLPMPIVSHSPGEPDPDASGASEEPAPAATR